MPEDHLKYFQRRGLRKTVFSIAQILSVREAWTSIYDCKDQNFSFDNLSKT